MNDKLARMRSFVNLEVLGVGKEKGCGFAWGIGTVDQCMVEVKQEECFHKGKLEDREVVNRSPKLSRTPSIRVV